LRDNAHGNSAGALGIDVTLNNVPSKNGRPNWQHMVTFTLGLADGLMKWQPDYETADNGDFKKITSGASGCYFSGAGKCNWPTVTEASVTSLDDLWHAAVNGGGKFYHAKDSETLINGLAGALAGMSAETAHASAAATSSPNITEQDNLAYITTYETVSWTGQLTAHYVSAQDGTVSDTIQWSAQAALDKMVGETSDSRTIYTFDSTAGNKLKLFNYANFSATEKEWFASTCYPVQKLSQCPQLSLLQQLKLLNGDYLVQFLRGRSESEKELFREREHVLGDTVNANPVYVRNPQYAFTDAVSPAYSQFKQDNVSRQPVVYLAANDGMLHAIDGRVGSGASGSELWAYVPRAMMPNLWKLADKNYGTRHAYFVDGTPTVMDVFSAGSWKTILVGGYNSGGRGYYALDVTNPLAPKALWEICSNSAVCDISDADLGYSFGNAEITKRASDGRWVVLITSGINNVSPGDGKGYLYVLDAITGAVLNKIGTGAGSTTTPSGLNRMAPWVEDTVRDNTTKYVYAGDIRGNVWRFDLTTASPSVLQLGVLTDASNRPQSVTTRPELTTIGNNRVVYIGTGRFLGLSDLQDPATWIPASTDAFQNSLYAFKDKGINYGNIRSSGNLVKQTLSAKNDLQRTTSTNTVDWNASNGWYVDFNPDGTSPGERVNIDPELRLGTLNVKTNVPSASACTSGGDSWAYQFSYKTGTFITSSPGQVAGQKFVGTLMAGSTLLRTGIGDRDVIVTQKGVEEIGVNSDGGGTSGKRVGWREITK
jgi:type IV pilus assembly protein PilY1